MVRFRILERIPIRFYIFVTVGTVERPFQAKMYHCRMSGSNSVWKPKHRNYCHAPPEGHPEQGKWIIEESSTGFRRNN